MLDWLKQRIISWLLSKYVGRWLVIDKKNLQAKTQGKVWTISAENIQVKTSCLDGMAVPVQVVSGSLKKLEVVWQEKHSIQVRIDSFHILVQSKKDSKLSPQQVKDIEQQAKRALLEQWELQLEESIPVSEANDDPEATKVGKGIPFRAFVRKLEVHVSTFELRLYDHETQTSLGLMFDSLSLTNAEVEGSKEFNVSKSVLLEGLCVDCEKVSNIEDIRMHGGSKYILSPTSVQLDLFHQRTGKRNPDLPNSEVSIQLDSVDFKLFRDQYRSSLQILNFFIHWRDDSLCRSGRPSKSPAQDPRGWWLYIQNVLIQDIRERRRKRSVGYLLERRKHRLKYIQIYTKQRGEDLNVKEQKEIEELEDQYAFHDVVYFRCTALKAMKSKQANVSKRKSNASWWSRMTAPKSQAAPEGAVEDAIASPLQGLSAEEKKSLLAALDVHTLEIGETYSSSSISQNMESRRFHVALRLQRCELRLIDQASHFDISYEMTLSSFDIMKNSKETALGSKISSFQVRDVLTGHLLCRRIEGGEIESEDRSSNLVDMAYSKKISTQRNDTSVELHITKLELVFSPHIMHNLVCFWEVSDASLDIERAARFAKDAYSGLKRYRQPGSEGGSSLRGKVRAHYAIDVHVAAPNMLIYENVHQDKLASCLLLKLGDVSVKNGSLSDEEKANLASQEGRLESHFATFLFRVEKIGIDLLRGINLKSQETEHVTPDCIMDDTHLAVTSHLITNEVNSNQEVVVEALVSSMEFTASKECLQDIFRIISSWTYTTVYGRKARSPAVLLAGWLLINGIKSRDGWCWRWVRLHRTGLHLCRSDGEEVAPDEIVEIDSSYFQTASVEGLKVIEIQPEAAGRQALQIFAAHHHNLWLSSIRMAQKAINPLVSWDIPKEAQLDNVIVELQGNDRPLDQAGEDRVLADQEQSDVLVLNLCGINSWIKQEKIVSWSVTMTDFNVESSLVRTQEEERKVVMSRLPVKSQMKLFRASHKVDSADKEELEIKMMALDVCLNQEVMRLISTTISLCSKSWDIGKLNLYKIAVREDGGFARAISSLEQRVSPREKDAFSPREEELWRAGLCGSLLPKHAPLEFFTSNNSVKKTKNSISFSSYGISIDFLDVMQESLYRIELDDVKVDATFFTDGTSLLRGDLDGIHILESVKNNSMYKYILTTSQSADHLIHLELGSYDVCSLTFPGYCKDIKIQINQPRIVFLRRVWTSFLGYFFQTFSRGTRERALQERREESEDRRDSSWQNFRRNTTRYLIDLQHPIVIIPRNSCSHQTFIADLGGISVMNETSLTMVSEWSVTLQHLRIDSTESENCITEIIRNANGSAKIRPITVDDGRGKLDIEISFEDVSGEFSDVQYGILSAILGENLTEKCVVEGEGGGVNELGEVLLTIDKLNMKTIDHVLQKAVDNSLGKLVNTECTIKIASADVSFYSALGGQDSSGEKDPIFRVSGKDLKILLKLFDLATVPESEDDESLRWSLDVSFSFAKVLDSRPMNAVRVLPFLTCQSSHPLSPCVELHFASTSSFHMRIDLIFREAEAIADAGLILRFLTWLGKGGQVASRKDEEEKGFSFAKARAGALLTKTQLQDARIHLVTDFAVAESDAFLFEGSLTVSFVQKFREFMLSWLLEQFTIVCHRAAEDHQMSYTSYDDEVFADPIWSDSNILRPASLQFSNFWSRDLVGCIPASVELSASPLEVHLTIIDMLIMKRILINLLGSLSQGDGASGGEQQERPRDQVEMSVRLPSISMCFGNLLDENFCAKILMEGVDGKVTRFVDGCFRITGDLLSLQVVDMCVAGTMNKDILARSEVYDGGASCLSFDIATYDSRSSLYPGFDRTVKMVIRHAQITILSRFLADFNHYLSKLRALDEASSMLEPGSSTGEETGAAQKRDISTTKVKVEFELEHPVLLLPRNSMSNDSLSADLGSIKVVNLFVKSEELAQDRMWSVELQDMKMESIIEGVRKTIFSKIDGVAHLGTVKGGRQEEEGDGGLSMLIDLKEAKGAINDCQYALLLAIFGENMTERSELSEDDFFHEAKYLRAEHKARNICDMLMQDIAHAKLGSKKQHIRSQYNVKIGLVELDVRVSRKENEIEMVRAVGRSLHVQFDRLVLDRDVTKVEVIDEDDKLEWRCRTTFDKFEVIACEAGRPVMEVLQIWDSGEALRKRSSPVISCAAEEQEEEASSRSSSEMHFGSSLKFLSFPPDIKSDRGVFILHFFKSSSMHTSIDLLFRKVCGVADTGLLFGILGSGRSIALQDFQEKIGAFRYSLVHPGGLIVQTMLPDATIDLVNDLYRDDADHFRLNGNVDVLYAAFEAESTVRVDIAEFSLVSCSNHRQASNARMQIVRPCLLAFSQQWYQGDGHRNVEGQAPQLFFSASDFCAMITYEDIILARGIWSNQLLSLRSRVFFSSPDPTKGHGAIQRSSSSRAHPPGKQLEQAADNPLRLRLFGLNMRITLVDDFVGRWVPLLRIGIPNILISGVQEQVTSKLRLGVEYFYRPTSSWRPAVEPWDVELKFSSGPKSTQLLLEAADEMCIMHISTAFIESLQLTIKSWTHDRRLFAILRNEDLGDSLSSPAVTQQQLHAEKFVPYSIHNLLAEPLVCILEDGSEHTVRSLERMEFTYEQVWRRRSGQQLTVRYSDDSALDNHVCLQLADAHNVFCRVSMEVEKTTSYIIERDAGKRSNTCPLHIVCDLCSVDGQKVLVVSSMLSVRNGSKIPVMSAISLPDHEMLQLGVIHPDCSISVPLQHARDGSLLFRPVVDGLDYSWCNLQGEAIKIRSVHDGSVRSSQCVDIKFQRIFGKMLPLDTTLVAWFTCAYDQDGVFRQGVLYVTDFALCHYSNLIGGEHKFIIPVEEIVSLQKSSTAYVFPNALEVRTSKRTHIFRTLLNRAETYKTILGVMPENRVTQVEEDVDDVARGAFNLSSDDAIVAIYAGSWYRDVHKHDGYIVFSTRHLLFMTMEHMPMIQVEWKDVATAEPKKSMLVKNNAILVTSNCGRTYFLSSSKWNRDKVLQEDIQPILKGNSSSDLEMTAMRRGSEISASGDAGIRTRTMTCKIIDPQATKIANDPSDQNAVYERQKLRARDSISWTVKFVDAVTKAAGAERTPGNPCIVELHPPWVVDNLSCHHLEVQLIDQTKSVIADSLVARGGSEQIFGVDLRRELHLRLRIVTSEGKKLPWSAGILVHGDSAASELEEVVDISDPSAKAQQLVVEVSADKSTGGFRISLYHRYWLLNLTGEPLFVRQTSHAMSEKLSTKCLTVGSPVGFDFASGGNELEMMMEGFSWTQGFSIDKQTADGLQLKLTPDSKGKERTQQDTPLRELYLNVSTSTASGKFDRTIVISFEPEIVFRNHLADPLVVWQRASPSVRFVNDARRPTLWLEPGQSAPFYPEGGRAKCRLSVNLAAEDLSSNCAIFAPVRNSLGPILLRCSDGRVIAVEVSSSSSSGPVYIHITEPSERAPHRITNHSSFDLAFQQVDASRKLVLRVKPFETVDMIWPEPMLAKVVVLTEIDGCQVPSSSAIDLDNLESIGIPIFQSSQGLLVRTLLEKKQLSAAEGGGSFVSGSHILKLKEPFSHRFTKMDVLGLMTIELLVGRKMIIGRNPLPQEGEMGFTIACSDSVTSSLVSRRHLMLQQDLDGNWILFDLNSTNGVMVNGKPVVEHRLKHGDVITIGAKLSSSGQLPITVSPFVYVYESPQQMTRRHAMEACQLTGTVCLDGGTKRLHIAVGDLEGGDRQQGEEQKKNYLHLHSVGLRFVLEDYNLRSHTEEILHLQLEDVNVSVEQDSSSRKVSFSIMNFQLDNQFDPSTPFPVVVFLDSNDHVACKIAVMEKLNQPGVRKYFNHVLIENGDPYVFLEDRLVAKLVRFGGKILKERADKSSNAKRTALSAKFTSSSYANMFLQEALREDIRILSDLVLNQRGSEEGAEVTDLHDLGAYIYIDELRWKQWTLHLSVMSTGDESHIIRRQFGRIVERLLRKKRVDDIIVSIPPLDKIRQLRTQTGLLKYLQQRLLLSLRKSFFSSKFLLKGLDAFLGSHSHAQKAGNKPLTRKRALGKAAQHHEHVSSRFVAVRALDKFGSVAGSAASAAQNMARHPLNGIKSGMKKIGQSMGMN
ncbi:hypothetical protein GUITHDRAFT_102151 [Guillardia theta CCMP2712]|uniref:FHA domain-containing protein n=4 Tax=Guillardia theta TaxID=55529 RepID=L1JVA3_GUITC|nr:hypothetical protein GUITHDRAFT_102151 [Guillardia theta CCMP2712]EKX52249.1 hypothetical protein GUITHDRAFT_102151 [Guillardia theta CCMP2712]|eukprot:XP_005839229.1 hypothetical protein GUITHDRAFT_102151 [Guillardia theta CCMP2712]